VFNFHVVSLRLLVHSQPFFRGRALEACSLPQHYGPQLLRPTTPYDASAPGAPLAQVTAQQESDVQQPQSLPTGMTLSSGADPPLAVVSAQATAVAQAQSGISSGPANNLSLGGPSDMQMAHDLGLLPTSPLSNAHSGGAGLVNSTAISGGPPTGQLGAAAPAVLPVLPTMLHHAPAPQGSAQQAAAAAASLAQHAQQAAAAAAAAPVAVQQQRLSAGAGLHVVGSQQPAVAAPTMVSGAAVMSMAHASLPGSQVGDSLSSTFSMRVAALLKHAPGCFRCRAISRTTSGARSVHLICGQGRQA
jgi:hypothetical protein